MSVGQYRHPIQIVSYTPTRHAVTNEAILTPTVVGSAWAQVIPLSGRMAETTKQLVEGAEIEFRFPYDPTYTVTPAHAIRYNGADWPVGQVTNRDMLNVEIKAVCRRAKT